MELNNFSHFSDEKTTLRNPVIKNEAKFFDLMKNLIKNETVELKSNLLMPTLLQSYNQNRNRTKKGGDEEEEEEETSTLYLYEICYAFDDQSYIDFLSRYWGLIDITLY